MLENGIVRTPTGYKAAYDTFREGGWPSLAFDPEWGGQGLPESVSKMVEEMLSAANVRLRPLSRPDPGRHPPPCSPTPARS